MSQASLFHPFPSRLAWFSLGFCCFFLLGCRLGGDCRSDQDCNNGLRCAQGSCVAQTGQALIQVALPEPAINKVVVFIYGKYIPKSISQNLVLQNGLWTALVSNIPRGEKRSFLVKAYDTKENILYQRELSSVPIHQNRVALVGFLIESKLPAPITRARERLSIQGFVLEYADIRTTETTRLRILGTPVTDTNAAQYSWTATKGALKQDTSSQVLWTAPKQAGVVTFKFTAKKEGKAPFSLSLSLSVIAKGPAQTSEIQWDTLPQIRALYPSQSSVLVGQSLLLTFLPFDYNSTVFAVKWKDPLCQGTFSQNSTYTWIWKAPKEKRASRCELEVIAKDAQQNILSEKLSLIMEE